MDADEVHRLLTHQPRVGLVDPYEAARQVRQREPDAGRVEEGLEDVPVAVRASIVARAARARSSLGSGAGVGADGRGC
jgi:hypothetical protein